MTNKIIGDIGQWLSVFVMIAGLALLCLGGIDSGTIVFSLGCVLETLATKIKYYGNRYIEKMKEINEIVLYDGKNERVKKTRVTRFDSYKAQAL